MIITSAWKFLKGNTSELIYKTEVELLIWKTKLGFGWGIRAGGIH